MEKTIKTINVDTITYAEFTKIVGKGNISSKLNEFMQNVVSSGNKNLDHINIDLLKKDIDRLTSHIGKCKAELDAKQKELEMILEKHQQEERTNLQNEKIRIQDMKSCLNCGNFISDNIRPVKFGDRFICKACYMQSTTDQIKLWSKQAQEIE